MTPPLLTADTWYWVKGNNLWTTHLRHTHTDRQLQHAGAAAEPKDVVVWTLVLVLPCNQSPLLVHNVVPGLRQLCQVGQQRTQVVELCFVVVTFSAEDLDQFSQTNILLEDLKQHRDILSYFRSCRVALSLTVRRSEDSTGVTLKHCGQVWTNYNGAAALNKNLLHYSGQEERTKTMDDLM